MDEARKRKFNESKDSNDDQTHTKRPTYASVDNGQQRIIGPALPHTTLSGTHEENISTVNHDHDSDSDDGSDDDDIGPVLPPAGREQPQLDNKTNGDSHKTPDTPSEKLVRIDKNKRDEWMLQPPERSDWTSKVDPTKLRHRKFQTGKSTRAPPVASGMDSSWTENAEQKMDRIKDAVMGVKSSAVAVESEDSAEAPRITKATQARIQKYNEVTRKDVAQQSKFRLGDSGDDPSMRPFDREKDMAASSNISSSQRREMLDRAADFDSRFTGGRLL